MNQFRLYRNAAGIYAVGRHWHWIFKAHFEKYYDCFEWLIFILSLQLHTKWINLSFLQKLLLSRNLSKRIITISGSLSVWCSLWWWGSTIHKLSSWHSNYPETCAEGLFEMEKCKPGRVGRRRREAFKKLLISTHSLRGVFNRRLFDVLIFPIKPLNVVHKSWICFWKLRNQ